MTKQHLKTGAEPDMPSNLFAMAPAALAIVMVFAFTRSVAPTLGSLSSGLLIAGVSALLTWILLASAMMSEMSRFIVAGTLRVLGLPIYAQGFGATGLFFDAELRETPEMEAGAIVEIHYRNVMAAPKPILISHDQSDVDWNGDLMRKFVQFSQAFLANFFTLPLILCDLIRAKVHVSPYSDQRVLAEICEWV